MSEQQVKVANLQEVQEKIARLEQEGNGEKEIAYLQRLIQTPLYLAVQGKSLNVVKR